MTFGGDWSTLTRMLRFARWSPAALLCLAGAACGDGGSGASETGETDSAQTTSTSSTTDSPGVSTGSGGGTTLPPGSESSGTPGTESSGDPETTTGDLPDGPDVPVVDCADFPASIDAESLTAHLAVLQSIADEHGNRSVGTPGYQASADYVRARLAAAGYDTAVDQDFEVAVFEELSPTVFSSGAPLNASYAVEEDFYTARYSGAGTVTAPVVPIDVNLGAGNSNNSGCQPEDYDGFPPGAIALVQRGACTFANKVNRATANGAAGVIIFNQGDNDNRMDAFLAAVDPANDNPPTVLTSYAVGEALALANGVEVTIDVDAITEDRTTRNILVERIGTDPSQVVMFGAHLDSVPAGPGINDNGTGSMAMLAIAERLAQCDPARTVRFAWWGAEEVGLVGSRHYVDNLSDADRQSLLFYLNFDMIGSPNYVRFVHDGDGSRYGNEGAPGSDALEQFFHDHFAAQDLPLEEARFDGRSDYGPFLDADIPTGGLATGAEGSKTGMQAQLYGGAQGEAYDPCYHLACDEDVNIATEEYARLTTAIAAAVTRFGIDGEGLFSALVDAPPQALQHAEPASSAGCGHDVLTQ